MEAGTYCTPRTKRSERRSPLPASFGRVARALLSGVVSLLSVAGGFRGLDLDALRAP